MALKTTVITHAKSVDNMIGRQFGHLIVDSRWLNTDRGAKQYQCRCVCGTIKLIRSDSLKSGHTTSCGCVRKGKTIPAPKDKPFTEQMQAHFYYEKPSGGRQYGFVLVKDIIGQRVAEKTEHGYFLTTAAARPTTTGKINTIVPIMMKRLFEAGIVDAQGNRTITDWMRENGISFVKRMRSDMNYLAAEHRKLSRGETDECN